MADLNDVLEHVYCEPYPWGACPHAGPSHVIAACEWCVPRVAEGGWQTQVTEIVAAWAEAEAACARYREALGRIERATRDHDPVKAVRQAQMFAMEALDG